MRLPFRAQHCPAHVAENISNAAKKKQQQPQRQQHWSQKQQHNKDKRKQNQRQTGAVVEEAKSAMLQQLLSL